MGRKTCALYSKTASYGQLIGCLYMSRVGKKEGARTQGLQRLRSAGSEDRQKPRRKWLVNGT